MTAFPAAAAPLFHTQLVHPLAPFVQQMPRRVAAILVLGSIVVVAGCGDESAAVATGGALLEAPPDRHAASPIGPYLNGALPDTVPTPGDLELIDAFPNLSWVDPIDLRAEPGGNRLWIAEVGGRIWAVDDDRAATWRDLVLDLRTRVLQNDRGGLLGFAFHPQWGQATSPNRGYLYVYYQWAPAPVQVDDMQPWSWAHYRRLSRFLLPDGQTAVDPSSEQVLIQQYAPSLLHAGGGMFFGTDGFLYLSVGDAGTFWDYDLHTQRLDKTLASGVLRIDVDRDPARSHAIRRQPVDVLPLPSGWSASATADYFVPDDNPWVDAGGGALEEFWALGLRSPHRMSQDPDNGDVWVGDVGQNTREEISLVRAGDNMQWPFMEGTFSLHQRPPAVIGREVGPVWDYGRTIGNCIVGGRVYHGSLLPELQGQLISVDNVRGTVFATTRSGFTQPISTVPGNSGEFTGASCVGVDAAGELFVCRWNGPKQSGAKVFALVRRGAASRQPPALLSQVHAFTDLRSLRPVPGLRRYRINAPFWSDDAIKTRFAAVPNDGSHDSPGERIGFSEEGEWSFPAGTVLVKHFELPLDLTDPGSPTRRLETRFLVKTATGWYGITYRWRPDGTDADLLADAATDQISVLTQGGPEVRTWEYPSRGQCLQCHNGNAGFALGLQTRQLNRPMRHPTTGAADNQLRIWNELGIFDPPIREARLAELPRLAALDDAGASLEHRVRSYFDVNCSQCHRPRGIFGALFDARSTTPPAEQGIVGGALYDPRGIPGAKVIALGQLAKSLAYGRISSVDHDLRMPPIGKNHADDTALAVLGTWIAQAQGIADFAAATPIGPPGLQVGFQDTSTVGGTAWRWQFGDGAGSTQQNPTHVYTEPGRYDVTLTVTAPGGPYTARRPGCVVVGTNVAVAGTARQSSTFNGAVAARAIDGNTDGDVNNGSVSETDFEANPWWEVDLGSVRYLSAVRLWNRTTLGKEWLAQFRVFLSDVPFVADDIDRITGQSGVTTIAVGPMVEGSLLLDVDRTARYLRVQSELSTVISLAEVEAFGAPPSSVPLDVAVGKTATQSSVDASAADLGPDNAADGDLAGGLDSGSLARTQRDAQAWWQVDLGAGHEIERVVLWNRTDCCSEQLANFHVLISDVPFAGPGLAAALAQPGTWNHRHAGFAARRSEIAVGRTGRWLRVQLEGRDHLQLAEVQVIGRPATGGGAALTLGNSSNVPVGHDFNTSNLVVDESDAYTNHSAVAEQIRVDRFGFVAWQVADPVTPFVVRVDGPGQFTVASIGTPRLPGDYTAGDNRFAFADGTAPVITLPPGATLAVGFLDAPPDGLGGGAGSVVSFDVAAPADDAWYSGGPGAGDSGTIAAGQAPVPGRRTLRVRRNYHFWIDSVRQ